MHGHRLGGKIDVDLHGRRGGARRREQNHERQEPKNDPHLARSPIPCLEPAPNAASIPVPAKLV